MRSIDWCVPLLTFSLLVMGDLNETQDLLQGKTTPVPGAPDEFTIAQTMSDGAKTIKRAPAQPGIVSVTFEGSDAEFTVELPLVAGGVGATQTQEHNCKPTANDPAVPVKFQCEVFQRILPPITNPAPVVEVQDSTPAPTRLAANRFSKPTVIVASGRFYNNGFASQVVTSSEVKIRRKADDFKKGIVITPKASPAPKGAKALPRYDGRVKYPAQWRVINKNNANQHAAVVLYDDPRAHQRS